MNSQVSRQVKKPARAGAGQRSIHRIDLQSFTLKDIPDVPLEIVLECLDEDEYGDGRLFAELFLGRCVFDHTDNVWYTWQGHYWRADDLQVMRHLVSGVLASSYLRAAAELNLELARIEDSESEQAKKLKRLIRELYARAHILKTVTRVKNTLFYASSFLPITADKWDMHKWLLGTPDGVIDLQTGTLRPGAPDDYIRTIIPTRWRGLNEPCPRFERFLQEIFEDRNEQERQELIAFLHRALGYGITGNVTEHLFLLLFGDEGRNGKDTLMTTLKKVLRDVVGAVPTDVLIGATKFSAPGAAKPHLVALQGKRIAWANETDKGQRFDIGQVKDITGGGDIPARQLYGKSYTFEPTHLLILLTNNKPHADANDKAFWERLCPIVFNVRFVENPTGRYERKPDKVLGAALEAEASGVLAWLVRGCLAWQEVGINIPASVLAERARYREEEDTLGTFINETCVIAVQCEVKAQVLYSRYAQWADDNGHKAMSSTAFGAEIGKRYKKVHTMHGWRYDGIGLRSDYPYDEMEPEPLPASASNGHIPAAPAPALEAGVLDI